MKNVVALFTVVMILSSACNHLVKQKEPTDQENSPGPEIPEMNQISHSGVYNVDGQFAGWPANNGAWYFPDSDEILIGFTKGSYNKDSKGHRISDTERLSYLARSSDGGSSWKCYDPENYVGDYAEKVPLEGAIDFTRPGFAMRVAAATYHGTDDAEGRFYYSYDKGQTWKGPHPLGSITDHPELRGKIITARTDYMVLDRHECMVMISAKPASDFRGESGAMTDKTLCIKTTDGGMSFEFLSWVVPLDDPYRAVMPNTVTLLPGKFVSVLRRKTLDTQECWVDAYGSEDGGLTWSFLSRVAETGVMNNGNPPAIARLRDGSLCVVYGNRDLRRILGRYSTDQGYSWGKEFVIREHAEEHPDADLGYPRLVCRKDGSLVAVYYWNRKDNPEQYIEASRWMP